jgi:hypothetical protein
LVIRLGEAGGALDQRVQAPQAFVQIRKLRQALQFPPLAFSLRPEPDIPQGIGCESADLGVIVVEMVRDARVGGHGSGQSQGQNRRSTYLGSTIVKKSNERSLGVASFDIFAELLETDMQFDRSMSEKVAIG